MKPILSIIIPVYNVEQYLSQCLDSVFNQIKPEYEVICINDGSTDHSRDILRSYELRYPELIVEDQENGGLIKARNKGYSIACGKYIYYLDSDDYLVNNELDRMINFCDTNRLDFALFNGKQSSGSNYYEYKFDNEIVLPGIELFELFFKQHNFFPPSVQWLYLYNKNFLDNFNIFFPEDNRQEDEPFTVKVFFHAKKAGCCNLNVIYHRVLRNGSITHTAQLPHLIDARIAWRNLYEYLLQVNCNNIFFFHKIFSLYQNTISKLTLPKFAKFQKGFFSEKDFKVIKNCAVFKDTYKYYWYNRKSWKLLQWYLNGNDYIFIKKVMNNLIVLKYVITRSRKYTSFFSSNSKL